MSVLCPQRYNCSGESSKHAGRERKKCTIILLLEKKITVGEHRDENAACKCFWKSHAITSRNTGIATPKEVVPPPEEACEDEKTVQEAMEKQKRSSRKDDEVVLCKGS